jgi:hypothetical protein
MRYHWGEERKGWEREASEGGIEMVVVDADGDVSDSPRYHGEGKSK